VAYRECAVAVLGSLRTAGTLTRSCYAHALRFETDSTCGRPGTVVCCRRPNSPLGLGVSLIRQAGQCGTDGERSVVHRAEGCLVTAPSRLVEPDRCGDGHLDAGEECDPPDDATCSAWCAACAAPADPGNVRTVACLESIAPVGVAASQGVFLATFTSSSRTGVRAMVQRLDAAGEPLGAPLPIASAGTIARPPGLSGADAVTADQDGFYVSWTASDRFSGLWRGRRAFPSGTVGGEIDKLDRFGDEGPFQCGPYYTRGPLALATRLDGNGAHHVATLGQRCGVEWLQGVPFDFEPMPSGPEPQILTYGGTPGRLARTANDVAALWGVTETPYPYVAGPQLRFILYAGWLEPGEQVAFPLLTDVQYGDVDPGIGLAAVGDVFLGVYPAPDGIRGLRFSRADGILDEPPGLLLATASGARALVATSDGQRWVLAWRESRNGNQVVRMVRVASDGNVVDSEPIDAVVAQNVLDFGVAADATSIVVIYTERAGTEATAVRMVRLPS
jgi:hypothetical protein